MLVVQYPLLEEAEWSEQLKNLKGDSHTTGASSENQDPTEMVVKAAHLQAT